MQAQKEVGSVCWGHLGKQEVSPWPNWPGPFPGDRFCPTAVNWTLSWLPGVSSFAQDSSCCQTAVKSTEYFVFLSIEMRDIVTG